MENKNYTLDDLRRRLLLPDADLERISNNLQPRLSKLKIECEIPTAIMENLKMTMKKYGIHSLFQWVLYSLIITSVYDDCIDYRLFQILQQQWQIEEVKQQSAPQSFARSNIPHHYLLLRATFLSPASCSRKSPFSILFYAFFSLFSIVQPFSELFSFELYRVLLDVPYMYIIGPIYFSPVFKRFIIT